MSKTAAAAAASMPAKAFDKPKRFTPASESRFDTSADFKFPLTSYIVEAGTPLAEVMKPEYWANITLLRAGCRIWVYAEDESFWAELFVRRVGQGYALVHELRSGQLGARADAPTPTEGYEIQFRGPVVKHRVVRKSDGHVLKQGLDSEEDARLWLREHKRVMAA